MSELNAYTVPELAKRYSTLWLNKMISRQHCLISEAQQNGNILLASNLSGELALMNEILDFKRGAARRIAAAKRGAKLLAEMEARGDIVRAAALGRAGRQGK